MRSAWLIWGAAVALFGCSEVTQIVVVVDSDMRVPDEIDEVRVEVEGMASGRQQATGRLEGPGALPPPRFVSLVHGGGSLGPIQVRAVGLRSGAEIVSRSAEVSFLPGRTVGLYLDLLGECVGIVCADGETCARGGCRAELVGPDELIDWTGPDHDAGSRPDGDIVPPMDGCVPMSEVCNGGDDDCDGDSDEDFDLATDVMHCGACDNACAAGANATATCAGSACGSDCAAGFGDCDTDGANGCELALTSLTDCGGCGVACDLSSATESCATGVCTIETCDAGFDDCNSDPADGCEASLAAPASCGSCSVTCSGGTPACAPDGGGGFTCVASCGAGLSPCSGSCVDTATDPLHCGGCDSACPTSMSCIASLCHRSMSVLQISSGRNHTCGVELSGNVVCWGRNDRGQLGDGTTTSPRTTPVTVVGLSDATQVSAGGNHTCARRATGAVACWGRSNHGQVGDGAMMTRTSAAAVMGLSDAIQVSAGRDHSCAVRSGGSVVCWGRNDRAQLGNGTTMSSPVPVTVMGLTDAVQVAASRRHTCAVRTGGAVVCWGDNGDGQLGDGTTSDRTTPVAVSGLVDATQVSAGDNHSCAVRMTGAVVCWGRGGSGQLGDGMASDSSVPVTVGGLGDGAFVSAGNRQTCVRRTTGAVRCWGDMQSGSLGGGSATQSDTPVDVVGLADAIDVGAGDRHACSARTSGGVSCWGGGGFGQLGDGMTTDRNLPVAVSGLP